jgi:serine/threonine protein phosphatase PrpC
MTTPRCCPQCDEPIALDDAFCESCGAAVSDRTGSTARDAPMAAPHTPPPLLLKCAECGGTVGHDGWCTVCGARASNGRDHVAEQPSATVAAVTDKGRVHSRNEDAFALAVADDAPAARPGASRSTVNGRFVALVVCDGVTTTTDSDVAAFAAARAARDLLAAAQRPIGSLGARQQQWAQHLRAAADAAGKAAETTAIPGDPDPPSCTFVAAVADGEIIVAGWVGDSRAYWLPDELGRGGATQLSLDDSWAATQIASGVAREVAEADPRAHAITKWLGADSSDVNASTATIIAETPGWLLVCSDGLWNYCSSSEDLWQLVATQPPEPLARAEALVTWANAQGGHDNITVALAHIAPKE